jgi:hypothetical protein
MPYAPDDNHFSLLVHLIGDAIISDAELSKASQIARKLLRPGRARVLSQCNKPCECAPLNVRGKAANSSSAAASSLTS